MIIYNIKTKAFTLVELIISITILAILATIAFINLGNYPADSRDSVRKSDLRTIEKAMTIYHIENGRYPTPDKDPVDGKTYFGEKAFKELGKINKLPLDPTTGKPYRYISLGVGYILVAALENGELFRVDYSRLAFQTCGMDYNSVMNKYGGEYNSPYTINNLAFTAMKADGTIKSWGNPGSGGRNYPTEKGFIKVFPGSSGFLAINPYGKIYYWGANKPNISDDEEGFIKIYSKGLGYTVMRVDGTLKTFGLESLGVLGQAPEGSFEEVYSTNSAFSVITKDGEIKTWGASNHGGTGGPSGNGWKNILSTNVSFTAIHQDGTLFTWGEKNYDPPVGKHFKKILTDRRSFYGLDTDGYIHIWGFSNSNHRLSGGGWNDIYSSKNDILGIKGLKVYSSFGTTTIPNNYKKLFLSDSIVIDENGKMHDILGSKPGLPKTNGWKDIISSGSAFAALNNDGSIYSDGFFSTSRPSKPPVEGKFVKIFSNEWAFVAMDEKGCLKSWGNPLFGGANAPTDCGRIEVNGSRVDDLEDCSSI